MGPYLDLLRVPHLGRLFAATLLARLPIGINGLATILFLRAETGSFATAGAAAGALALGIGLGAPVGARIVDAIGPRVLLGLALAHAAGLGGLVALGTAGAPAAALIACAGVAGVTFPPTSSVMRALYPRLLGDSPQLVHSAFALDSVLTETLFVVGPLLIALLVAVAAPGAALVLSGAAVAAGTIAFLAAMPAPVVSDADEPRPSPGRLGALAAPGIRTLVGAMLPVGFAFGAVEVAIPAFATEEGRPELAGILIAIWSVASAGGGLLYGARPRRSTLLRVHLWVAALLPLGLAPVVLATSPLAMALLVLPAGVFIGPLLATRNELAGRIAPAGAETEAFTWPLTALVSGLALGAATGGVLIDASGWRAAVAAGVLAATLGAFVSLVRRRTLSTAAAVPVSA